MSMGPDGSGQGGWGGESVIRNPSGSMMEVRGDKREEDSETEERRYVVKYRTGYVPWAMNLLATEEDLRVGMERIGLNGEINVAGTEREPQR